MAIQVRDDDKPGPDGEKPHSLWRSDDGWTLERPFCGREELSDDRLGYHLVRHHWREIDHVTRRERDKNR